MTTISAQALLISRNKADPNPNRKIATLLLRYPRWIHAEGRTHRQLRIGEIETLPAWEERTADKMSPQLAMAYDKQEEDLLWEPRTPSLMEDPMLSRNAASSRAIPVHKMIDDVLADPAVPLFWGKNQKGMQAREECSALVPIYDWAEGVYRDATNEEAWLEAMHAAIRFARAFDGAGYHKQIVNRLLEPFSHITVVCTATEWDNFFALRIHDDAEPHIKLLAERMKEAIDTAPVQELEPGEWHMPFVSSEFNHDLHLMVHHGHDEWNRHLHEALEMSVACCGSTSYKTVEGFDMTQPRAHELYERFTKSIPMHASPTEHQAQADGVYNGQYHRVENLKHDWMHPDQHANFVGFRQYRHMLPGG